MTVSVYLVKGTKLALMKNLKLWTWIRTIDSPQYDELLGSSNRANPAKALYQNSDITRAFLLTKLSDHHNMVFEHRLVFIIFGFNKM
jgi:hypothetical protein